VGRGGTQEPGRATGVGSIRAIDPDLALALDLADLADDVTRARFRAADLVVDTKPDMTPVTEADRAVERLLRDRLAHDRPGDAVLGEELGESSQAGGRRWIIDPIDGTKGYVRGLPVWATLLALEVDGVIQVGVVSAPALARRWWAARGVGAFANGERIRVSDVADVADAQLSYDGIEDFDRCGLSGEFLALARSCWRTRAFGDFWSHVLVAEGSVDVSVEPFGLSPWDVAPLMVIVEEAGGRLTDLAGAARIDGGAAVATNGRLHDAVLTALRRGSAAPGTRP
jgi:histidinol-phosphatase